MRGSEADRDRIKKILVEKGLTDFHIYDSMEPQIAKISNDPTNNGIRKTVDLFFRHSALMMFFILTPFVNGLIQIDCFSNTIVSRIITDFCNLRFYNAFLDKKRTIN